MTSSPQDFENTCRIYEQAGIAREKIPNYAVLKAAYERWKSSGGEVVSVVVDRLKLNKNTEYWLNKFITQDTSMLVMKEQVKRLAVINDPVLITGETGTGKELIAHALHGQRTGQFVCVNCGGFPEQLVDSVLFGHKKGSFTGAICDEQGLFMAAHNGTLFLDEIGELPLLMQVKLLRAIQEHTIKRVGDPQDIDVNCRIVAATHCDLFDMADKKRFREDLLWRINTFTIKLTPLRERVKDIVLIARSMANDKIISEAFKDTPEMYRLGGNVRELQQMIRRKQVLG